MNIWDQLNKPVIGLSPMDGITDAVFRYIVAKYGKPNVQILANWDTEEEAFSHEILLIDCFKELGHKLCNLSNGGEGPSGLKHSEESKEKMRIANMHCNLGVDFRVRLCCIATSCNMN